MFSDFEIIFVDIPAQLYAPEAYPIQAFESLYKTGGYKLMEYKANNVPHNVWCRKGFTWRNWFLHEIS